MLDPVAHVPQVKGTLPTVRLLCLTGFMGSGKTTVGQLLARQLAWRFEDLDVQIEQRTGLSIPAIFERVGEPGFRNIEREQIEVTLARSGSGSPMILALGGGTYAQPGMAERLRDAGAVVVWLDCEVELLLARCATMSNRPLFRDEPSFRTLLAERRRFYQQADYRVSGGEEPARVVGRILDLPIFARFPGQADEPSSPRVKS